VAQKKKEQLRRQFSDIQTQKMMQTLEEQRSEISRQKFNEWLNKKELERLGTIQANFTRK
jgi:hypothetical protein